jgi:hypothetical protein
MPPCTRVRIILKRSAHPKDATLNPSMMCEAKRTNSAFRKRLDNPRLRIVSGSIKIFRSGLMIPFRNPSTAAVNNAVAMLRMLTPGKR